MSFQEKLMQEIKEQNDKIIESLNDTRPKPVEVTFTKKIPVRWDYTVCDKKSSTKSKYEIEKPDLEIEAPDEFTRSIESISVTGDTVLLENAKMVITVDDAKIFETKSFGSLQYANGVSIIFDNGYSISQHQKVKFYAFTEDGDEVNFSAIVRFGEC